MLTVLTGLSSAFSFALSDMFLQRASRMEGVARVMLWVFLIGVAVTLPAAVVIDGVPATPEEWRGFGFSAAAGVVYVGAYGCLLAGLRRGQLSLVAVLSSLQGLFTAVFSVASGERLTLLIGAGLGFTVIGGGFAAMRDRTRSATGAGWAVLSALLFAANLVLYDRADSLSWLSQAAYSRMASAAVFIPFALVITRPLIRREACGFVAAGGVLEIVGLSMVTISVERGPLSVAGVTIAQFATFAVLLGVLFLHERPKPHQLFGMACTVIGVSILALGS